MIRPAARAVLHRHAELLAGAGLLALGLWWLLLGGGLMRWVGGAVALGGATMMFTGWQRTRFRHGGDGPGVVRVVEGRIEYFGPYAGGIVGLDDLRALTLDPAARQWRLDRAGAPPLTIPVDAEGAEALFDAFTHLPGLSPQRLLRALEGDGALPVVIWRAVPVRDTAKRLH